MGRLRARRSGPVGAIPSQLLQVQFARGYKAGPLRVQTHVSRRLAEVLRLYQEAKAIADQQGLRLVTSRWAIHWRRLAHHRTTEGGIRCSLDIENKKVSQRVMARPNYQFLFESAGHRV